MLKKNFKDSVRMKKSENKELQPAECILLYLIELMLSNGKTIDQIEYDLLELFESRATKNRYRKSIHELYDTNVKDKKKFDDSEKMEDFLQFFGAGDKGFFNQKTDD